MYTLYRKISIWKYKWISGSFCLNPEKYFDQLYGILCVSLKTVSLLYYLKNKLKEFLIELQSFLTRCRNTWLIWLINLFRSIISGYYYLINYYFCNKIYLIVLSIVYLYNCCLCKRMYIHNCYTFLRRRRRNLLNWYWLSL